MYVCYNAQLDILLIIVQENVYKTVQKIQIILHIGKLEHVLHCAHKLMYKNSTLIILREPVSQTVQQN